jgi:DNA-binding response OmpR family regulator
MPQKSRGRLLVVDDEIELMTALSEILAEQGFETKGVSSGAVGLRELWPSAARGMIYCWESAGDVKR